MDETEAQLVDLNLEIVARENTGDRPFFEDRLAREFAFRRSNAVLEGRDQFIKALVPGGKRITDPRSVTVTRLGSARALVTCLVSIGDQRFDNARLFIKEDGRWRLLAWANEKA